MWTENGTEKIVGSTEGWLGEELGGMRKDGEGTHSWMQRFWYNSGTSVGWQIMNASCVIPHNVGMCCMSVLKFL